MFTADSDLRECTTVEAIDDLVSELSEQLAFSFTSQGIQTSTLTITDNDSELLYYV